MRAVVPIGGCGSSGLVGEHEAMIELACEAAYEPGGLGVLLSLIRRLLPGISPRDDVRDQGSGFTTEGSAASGRALRRALR